MQTNQLHSKIASLPLHLQQEVIDFVEFLEQKRKQSKQKKERKFGYAKEAIKLHDNFDDPIEDFKDYM
jgi:hypothetical protein